MHALHVYIMAVWHIHPMRKYQTNHSYIILCFTIIYIHMLPTDLQLLARRPAGIKAVRPVSKPSLSTYVHVSALFSLAYWLP